MYTAFYNRILGWFLGLMSDPNALAVKFPDSHCTEVQGAPWVPGRGRLRGWVPNRPLGCSLFLPRVRQVLSHGTRWCDPLYLRPCT